MDKREAIQELKQWRDQMESHGVPDYGKKLIALDLAIEALRGGTEGDAESATTTDCISREQAIEALDRIGSVDTEADREYARDIFDNLPLVTPTERTGEWIDECENGHGFWVGICNQCGKERHVDNYCPNCGAKMKGGTEDMAIEALSAEKTGWIPVSEPPKDGRNVFFAYGTNNFKSCCIGHYDHSMKIWYEDKNFFAKPIYDCKYWCDIPELPDMGDSQFEPYKGGDTE